MTPEHDIYTKDEGEFVSVFFVSEKAQKIREEYELPRRLDLTLEGARYITQEFSTKGGLIVESKV